ncbi:obscurin-like protein 1, partial [Microcaecilia unicolor]|uniref:Obscurin-like protein 1 n=1 Tax=Microcaecilia unicolor TaxID=1415580 RepID=A0A6P7WPH6_9AMPH
PPVRIVNTSDDFIQEYVTGEPVVLSCELSRAGALVHWYKDGVEVETNEDMRVESDGVHHRLIIPSAKMQDSGDYTVKVTDPAVRIVHPTDHSVKLKFQTFHHIELKCELSRPNAEVRWFKDGLEVDETENLRLETDGAVQRLHILSASMEDSGEYICDTSDDSVSFDVKVTDPAVRILHPSNHNVKLEFQGSDHIELKCELSRPNAEVRWFKDGLEVDVSENLRLDTDGAVQRLTILSASMEDSGEYVCDANDDFVSFDVRVTEPLVKILDRENLKTHLRCLPHEDLALQVKLSLASADLKWFKDGEKIVDSSHTHVEEQGALRSLLLLGAESGDSGEYLCVTHDDNCIFYVTVEEPPVQILNKEDIQNTIAVLQGEKVTLTVKVSEPTAPVQWLRNCQQLSSGSKVQISNEGSIRLLTIEQAEIMDSGTYTCTTTGDELHFSVQVNVSMSPGTTRKSAKTEKEKAASTSGESKMAPGTPRSEAEFSARQLSQIVAAVETALEPRFTSLNERLGKVDGLMATLVSRATEVETRVSAMEDAWQQCGPEVESLKVKLQQHVDKLDELENRARRSNLRLVGLPETIPEKSLSTVLEEWLVKEFALSDSRGPLCLERAHRIGRQQQNNQRPRVVIIKVLNYIHKEEILRGYRLKRESLTYAGVQIRIFQDYSTSLQERRRKFHPVCTRLVERNQRFMLMYPATLKIQHEGKWIPDPGERSGPDLVDYLEDSGIPRLTAELRHYLRSLPASSLTPQAWEQLVTIWGLDAQLRVPLKYYHASLREHLGEVEYGKLTACWNTELAMNLQMEKGPVKFVNKQDTVEDILALEGSSAVLVSVVSKQFAAVTWYRHQQALAAGQKYEMRQEGCTNSLVVSSIEREDSGLYTCLCKGDQMQFDVRVKELPVVFTRGLYDLTAQRDKSVVFQCELCKMRGDVMWMKDGRLIQPSRRHVIKAEGRERSLTILHVDMADAGEYSCESKDDKTLATLTVETARAVEFISELHNVTVLEGDTATFKCVVSPEDVDVCWLLNGSPFSPDPKYIVNRNGMCHSLTIRQCQISDGATVTAVVDGVVTKARLNVQEAQAMFLKKLQNVIAEEMQDVTLEVEVSVEGAEVQWLKQGVVIQPSGKYTLETFGQRHMLTIHNVTFSDRGNYRCESLHDKTQARLCVDARKVMLRTPLVDMEVCEKETVTFQLELSHPGVEGVWTKDGIRVKPNSRVKVSASGCLHSLTLSALRLEDSGDIIFSADNIRSCARLRVREPPVTIIRKSQDVGVPETVGARFECELSRAAAEVKWYKDGKEMETGPNCRIYSMGRRRIVQLSHCRLEDAGTYTCDAGDCAVTSTLQVY